MIEATNLNEDNVEMIAPRELRSEDFFKIRDEIEEGKLTPETAADLMNLLAHTKEYIDKFEQKELELEGHRQESSGTAEENKIAEAIVSTRQKLIDLRNREIMVETLVKQAMSKNLIPENYDNQKEVQIGVPEFMKCKNCGAEIFTGSKFCTNCGLKLTSEAGEATKEYDEWEGLLFSKKWKEENGGQLTEEQIRRLNDLEERFKGAAHSQDYIIASQLHLKNIDRNELNIP